MARSEPNSQLVLLPESVELEARIGSVLTLIESLTSTYDTMRGPCGSMFHCVPSTVLRRMMGFPEVPVKVNVPSIVWVLPASNVSCLPGVAQARSWNVAEPEMIAGSAPSKTIVPLLWLNVPPAVVKSPPM